MTATTDHPVTAVERVAPSEKGLRRRARQILGLTRLVRLWCTQPPFRRAGLFFVDRGADLEAVDGTQIEIGRGVVFLRDSTLRVHGGSLRIGPGSFFNRGCHIVVRERLEIGADCLFGEGVAIHDHDHVLEPADVPPAARGFTSAPVVIEDHVWIGAKATVLQGVRIGFGSVVAAHSVVTRDVPPKTLVAGAPATVKRSLS